MKVFHNYRYVVTEPCASDPTGALRSSTYYFTLDQVAKHCGCHYNTARKMMNGVRTPPALARYTIERTNKRATMETPIPNHEVFTSPTISA